jgi:hypothetical protein
MLHWNCLQAIRINLFFSSPEYDITADFRIAIINFQKLNMSTTARNFIYTMVLLPGIFLSQNMASQQNYLPGYIIMLNRDTVRGFIDYRNWDQNPTRITFKNEVSGSSSIYRPMEIKSFGVLDEVYESALVERESSLTSLHYLQYDPALQIETDTVFLQTIVSGTKDLLYLKDRDGKDQFYVRQDSGYSLLIYKKYIKMLDDRRIQLQEKSIVMENKKYQGQLTVYLQDCAGIRDLLKYTGYNKQDMEKLFVRYYACTNAPLKFKKKTEKIFTQFGVMLGYCNTRVEFKSEDNYLTKVNFKPSSYFTAGLFLNLVLPRNQGKLSINNELIYTGYRISGHFDDRYNPATIDIAYNYIKINNILRYKFPVRNFFIFANAGMSNGFVVSETNKRYNESIFHQNTVDKAIGDTRKYEQGYIIGIGSAYKKFMFEFRLENGNGISVYQSLNTPTRRLYCFLGYMF